MNGQRGLAVVFTAAAVGLIGSAAVVDNGSIWGVWTVVVVVVAAFRWCGRRIGIARRLLAEPATR